MKVEEEATEEEEKEHSPRFGVSNLEKIVPIDSPPPL